MKSLDGLPWLSFFEPDYAVYQSDSDYTIFTLKYDNSFSNGPNILAPAGEGKKFDFRVQAVVGYFQYREVYEGEGSDWVEFELVIPRSDKPGTSSPIMPSYPGTSSTSDPTYTNSPSPQKPYQTYLAIIILTAVVLITIPLVILAYQYGQRKTKPAQTSPTVP